VNHKHRKLLYTQGYQSTHPKLTHVNPQYFARKTPFVTAPKNKNLQQIFLQKESRTVCFPLDLSGITFSHRARQRPSWQRSPVSCLSLHEADTVCAGKRDADTLQ